MNFAIDDSILANIKHDSEDDEIAAQDDDMGAPFILEAETAYETDPTATDPLVDDGSVDADTIKKEFQWQCIENDFLKPYVYDDGDEQELLTDEVKVFSGRKNKRAKIETNEVWKKVPFTPPIADDLPGFVPVGKGPAKTSIGNPLESWHLLFDVPMLSQVVKSTNEVIKAIKKREAHQKRLTDPTEMRAWIGLNYLCGVLRNSSYPGPIDELWSLELGNAIFRATMTYKRFEFLGECLRTAEQSTEVLENESALNEIASIWEKLVINCRSYYAPSDFCMIDEQILDLSMDAKNPFDHTISTQPERKGLRFITMCDAKTLYISNALVAIHGQPVDEEVYQLVSDIKGTRRCLGINERFSRIALFQKLKQCQLQVVGTFSNEIPPELENESDEHHEPQIWYTQNDTTIISGLDETQSPSGFLLTCNLSARIDAIKLAQTIKVSNIKAFEQMQKLSTRHARPKNFSWSLEFFYFMLDISAFNAWILYSLSENGDAIEQRDFQRQLGLYLTQQQLKQRIHMNIKLPLPLKLQIAEILGENVDSMLSGASHKATQAAQLGSIPAAKALVPEGIVLQARETENRRRCRGCPPKSSSKIKTRCQQCLMPFCMRHLISRCESCSGYELQKNDLDTAADKDAFPD